MYRCCKTHSYIVEYGVRNIFGFLYTSVWFDFLSEWHVKRMQVHWIKSKEYTEWMATECDTRTHQQISKSANLTLFPLIYE